MTNNNENRPGYKKTKIGWIPEEWETPYLKNCAYVKSSNVDKKSYDTEIPVKLCNYTDVYYNNHITKGIDFMLATAKQAEIEKFTLLLNDVIITKDSESADDIAVPAVVSEHLVNVLCGYHLTLIRPDLSKLSGQFLNHLLCLHRMRHYFFTLANGVTRFGLPLDSIQKANIPLPPLPEQKKIAEVLSTWDSAIEKTERLIEKCELRKKGLVQLTVNSEQLSVKTENWKEIRIGDIANQISLKNKNGFEYIVLSCTKHQGLVSSLEYFGKQIYSKNLSTYKIVSKGQFAYATNHIEEGSIGYQDSYDKALISPMYTVFETNDKINDSYLYRLLKSDKYIQIYQARTSASVDRRGSLRWNEFSRIKIPLPSIEEQNKIAKILDTADQEINKLHSKLDALKEQKKGMMQKLLTGEVRTVVSDQ